MYFDNRQIYKYLRKKVGCKKVLCAKHFCYRHHFASQVGILAGVSTKGGERNKFTDSSKERHCEWVCELQFLMNYIIHVARMFLH